MFSWLKKHFIPHEGNDHRPHILRDASIRNILILVVLIEISTFLIPTITQINKTGGMASVLPAVLSNLTNEERQSQNLTILTVNPILNKAAEMKATDMATKGYFAHTSPEGKTPWYWLSQVGYQYQYAGENLAINFNDSKDVTNAWMNSPTHKANIVKGNYTEVGTGIATGLYEGQETIFVAQVYANPLPKSNIQIQPTKVDTAANKATTLNEPKNVLGAETKAVLENVVITKQAVEINPTAQELKPIQNPNVIQNVLASPRNSSNTIMFTIFGIIFIAIILNIIIKIKHHHPDLITNGLIVLAIILAILIANFYFSNSRMITSQSIDYSNLNK